MEIKTQDHLESSLSAREEGVLRDLVHALRSLRYGSVVLTVHDGRLVEIQKTEKIRMNPPRPEDEHAV